MRKIEDEAISTVNDLEGLPGIGVARREALAVAGITTRAAFARSTVEQLISLTGIQRTYAVKALEAARLTSVAPPEPVVPATDEALPNSDGISPTEQATETISPEPEPPFELDKAIFRATTAVADASRKVPDSSSLMRELVRIATLLEELPQSTRKASAKCKKRVTAALDSITKQLEKAAASDAPLKPTASERLKDSVKMERELVKDLIKHKSEAKTKSRK